MSGPDSSARPEDVVRDSEAVARLYADEEMSDRGFLAREVLAARELARVHQERADRLEEALRVAILGFNDISLILESEGDEFKTIERAYLRACDEWRYLRAALAGGTGQETEERA